MQAALLPPNAQIHSLENPNYVENPSGEWVALIHIPRVVERKVTRSELEELAEEGLEPILNKTRFPALRIFQYLDPFSVMKTYATVRVHPGTQMGYHVRQVGSEDIIERLPVEVLDAIRRKDISDAMFKSGEIQILKPVAKLGLDFLNSEEPGYRHFSVDDAKKLIANHQHESWIARALVGETRETIIRLANKRMQAIVSKREKERNDRGFN